MPSYIITDPDERQLESLRGRLRRKNALWNQMTEELEAVHEAVRPVSDELSALSASKEADLTFLARENGGSIPPVIYRRYMKTRETRLGALVARERELIRRGHAMQVKRADLAAQIQVLQENINGVLRRMGQPAVSPARRRI